MAYFKRDRFNGTAPGVSPRLLAEQFGQIAENVDLESGRLIATKTDSDVYTLQTGSRRSIYYYRDTSWLEWTEDNVSVVPGPIPGDTTDRLYFTGDDYPRVGTALTLVSGTAGYPVNSFRLGVPAPSAIPSTTKTITATGEISVAAAVGNNATLVLGGALASGGSVTLTHGRLVTILSTGDDSGISFTVVGTDVNGSAQTESITGVNAGTATSVKSFKTITSITAAGDPAGNVSASVVADAVDGTDTPNDVSYVYTFVTADGREGPPSPPSTVIEMVDGDTVTVSIPSHTGSPSTDLNFTTGALKRIYRSNTGSTNTTFQFVNEVTYATQTYPDFKDAANLGEVLPSDTWIGPPDDNSSLYPDGPLKGLIPLAQGVMAGFTGKRFCLSEPYLPHAWPISYRITTEEDIVAIASTANGVAALTDGHPYFITGTDPAAMTAVRIDLAQACVNINSVVDMGDYVLYAGPDGLCAVQSASGSVVTAGLISVEQWNSDFNPTTIRAFKHEGTYVAFHSGGGWVYDPRGEENALTTLTVSAEVRGGYTNPKDGELYIIVANKIKKYRGGSTSKTAKFKSKKFVTPAPVSMGWVSVHANEYPATVKVYGDGTLIAHYTLTKSGSTYTQATTVPSNISNGTLREPIMRMPAVVAQEWEVQVEGTDINEFCLSQSMEEIRGT